MKKSIFASVLLGMILLLNACTPALTSQEIPSPKETPLPDNSIAAEISSKPQQKDADDISMSDCAGAWRKAPNDTEGFAEVYSFDEEGAFNILIQGEIGRSPESSENIYANSEFSRISSGSWFLEDNAIILRYGSGDKPIRMEVELFDNEETPGLLLNGELYLNVDKQHLYFQTLRKNYEDSLDFTGEWQRTNVIRALSASLEIYEQTDSEFQFNIFAGYAANAGTLSNTAYFIAPNQAYCFIEPEYSDGQGLLLFTLLDDKLCLEYDGSIYALEFGHNVTASGDYTKDEPYYTNANIVNEILPTQELRDRMRSLVGDSAYEQLIFVMEDGICYQYLDDEYDIYTYSGVISGIGVGVHFLIKDDGKIYCLGYWLEGPGHTFYTNDPEYKDKLPEWMGDSPSDLLFVYKDV